MEKKFEDESLNQLQAQIMNVLDDDQDEPGGFVVADLEQDGIFAGIDDEFSNSLKLKLGDDSLQGRLLDMDDGSSQASKKGAAAQIFA